MALSTENKNYHELRTGYDILIDIDSKLGIEEAKLAASLICQFLEKYGITYQHTFVQIDAEGKEITKWNGGKIDELLTNIK